MIPSKARMCAARIGGKVGGALARAAGRSWWIVAVFTAATLLDLALQSGARNQFEEYLHNPFLHALNSLGVALKWGLLMSAPAFFFGRRMRVPYLALWGYVVAVESVEVVARLRYGMSLDGDWLMILLTSSAAEMREFFGQLGGAFVCAVGVCAAAALAGGWFFFRAVPYPQVSRSSVAVGCLCCLPFVLSNIVLSNPLAAANDTMYAFLPVDTVHNCAMYRDMVRTVNEPRLPAFDASAAERVKDTLGVFVIGESVARSHWHLYGYARPTTPMIDAVKDELVVFRDVKAIHSTTGKSLRTLLTEVTRENPRETRSTFPQQCAAAGYRCSLFSAHSRWGRWEGVETLLFAGCATKHYLHEQDDAGPDTLDDALLPPFHEELLLNSGSGLIAFLHLMGSHAPPMFRYPPGRSIYPRHKGDVAPGVVDPKSVAAVMADTYDNSIAFTDILLGRVIDMLKGAGRPCFMVYLSDHGETPMSGFWRDQRSPDLFDVPFVIWFSPEYRKRYPEIVASASRLAEASISMDRLLPVFRMLVHLDPP